VTRVSTRPILSSQHCATGRVHATSSFVVVIDRVYLQLERDYERAGGGVVLIVHMRRPLSLELGLAFQFDFQQRKGLTLHFCQLLHTSGSIESLKLLVVIHWSSSPYR
jgi:hypothetical protein